MENIEEAKLITLGIVVLNNLWETSGGAQGLSAPVKIFLILVSCCNETCPGGWRENRGGPGQL